MAFDAAKQKGYAIELDVYIISDGTAAVFHHQLDTKKLTGQNFDLIQLKKEDLKNIFLCGTNQHIPTLNEVLALIDGKVPLLIEIKNGSYKAKQPKAEPANNTDRKSTRLNSSH